MSATLASHPPALRAAGRAVAAAGLGLLAVPTIAATGWYLSTGGGRDAEAPVLAALSARAAPGDGVLYDIAQMDPFARRPRELMTITRNVTLDPSGEARLDAAGVRWVVRSTAEPTGPIYTPSLLARLDPVTSVEPPALLQSPWTITLYRLRPP